MEKDSKNLGYEKIFRKIIINMEEQFESPSQTEV